ncbi:MAG: peptide deformylase [Pseudomonadota bacterium]
MVRLRRCLPVAGLSLAACGHHHPGPAGPEPLSSAEIAMLDADALDRPLAMMLAGTPEGDDMLRRLAQPVGPDDPTLARLEARMRATLLVQRGVGLAAPQVGISRRVILVERQDRASEGGPGPVELYLNPRIMWRCEETVTGWEGCLSVPGWRGEVIRPERIRLAYDLRGGGRHEEDVEGWTARIFQHEIDHLDGVLYTDKVHSGLVDEVDWKNRREGSGDTDEPRDHGE